MTENKFFKPIAITAISIVTLAMLIWAFIISIPTGFLFSIYAAGWGVLVVFTEVFKATKYTKAVCYAGVSLMTIVFMVISFTAMFPFGCMSAIYAGGCLALIALAHPFKNTSFTLKKSQSNRR